MKSIYLFIYLFVYHKSIHLTSGYSFYLKYSFKQFSIYWKVFVFIRSCSICCPLWIKTWSI